MAIEKQIWTDQIKEGFIPDTSFLAASEDMSELVEYNKINLAAAGVDPEVLIDNASYPIDVVSRDDVPIEVVLHTFDTKNTVVRSVEAMEASYAKMESVIRGHRRSLQTKAAAYAAHAWAPQSHTDKTPVLQATGAVDDNKRHRLTFEDILRLERAFRDVDAPLDRLSLVLTPEHLQDLQLEDISRYRVAVGTNKVGAFKLFTFTGTPWYNTTNKTKLALGAVTDGTSAQASIAYVDSEVMRAMGDMDMFLTEKSPTERGDVVGFQMRFTAMPFQAKYIASIYSTKTE